MSREQDIGAGVKRTENKLFKGAVFNKDMNVDSAAPKQLMRPIEQSSTGQVVNNEFDDRDDEEKAAKAIVAQQWNDKQDAGQFAMSLNNKYGIDMQKIGSAIREVQKRGNRVPWWSAARDFNLELFRDGNAGQAFRLNPNVIAAVQQKKY